MKKYFTMMIVLCLACAANATTTGDVVISPENKGVLIDKFFYDFKISTNPNTSDAVMDRLFLENGFNGVRTSIFGTESRPSHPTNGVVVAAHYTGHIKAVLAAKKRNPDILVFASKKLDGQNSFPDWTKDSRGVMPVPYAEMIVDYIEHMNANGIEIDILGFDNEDAFNEGEIKPEIHKDIVDELRRLSVSRGFKMPLIIGNDDYSPKPDWMEEFIESGWGDRLDIYGTHYYPRPRPLEKLQTCLDWAGSREKWHTELHWDKKPQNDDLLEAEQAIVSLWQCIDNGMNGFMWWSFGSYGFRGTMMTQFTVPLIGAHSVGVDDVDGSDITTLSKLQTRAFLKGNQLTVYAVNRSTENSYSNMVFRIDKGRIMSDVSTHQWTSAADTTPATSTVMPLDGQSFSFDVPTNSYSSFTFTYEVPAETLPYAEGFEIGTGNWVQSSDDDFDWSIGSGYTDSNTTGPSDASEGLQYLFVEGHDGGQYATTSVECSFDLGTAISAELSFDYHMTGKNIGTLSVDVYDGTTWTADFWSLTGEQQSNELDSWLQATVDLSDFIGNEEITLRLRYNKQQWAYGDPAIDNIQVVGGYNVAPVADSVGVVTDEDTSASITLTGSDANGDSLTYVVTGEPIHGDLDGDAPNLIYTPNANFIGFDSFTFTVNDGTVDSATATVAITVNAAQGLVAHWPLDDATGTVASDLSGHGYNGAVSGEDWVVGISGGALDFDGSSSRVTLPASAFASISDQVTIAMWVYGDTTQPRNDSLFYATDASGNRVLNIHLPWGDSMVYWDAGDSSGFDRVSKAASSSQFMGEWNHWVFTKNTTAGEMNIYLNGALWHTGTGKTKTMSGITAAVLGAQISSFSYDGMIDDVQLYNVALDETEVSDLYGEMTVNGVPASWLASYGLELSEAGTLADTDGDGRSNLEEYLSGKDPLVSDNPPGIRATEYYLTTGDFSGTSATITLDEPLSDDYFILVRGSRAGDGLSMPDNDYARVTGVPWGVGDMVRSGSLRSIVLTRSVADFDWEGVVTVVECGNSTSSSGFKLIDVADTSMSGSNGTDTCAAWDDLSQVVLFGGYRGGGATLLGNPTARNQGSGVYARLYPSGTNTLNWTRNAAGETQHDAAMTTFVVEWGSAWDVQHVNVSGTNGGNGANAVDEYTTAAIASVDRASTWVWATGTRADAGVGDSSEACLVTLGDGVNENASESTVAVGSEYTDAYDFDVYTMTHVDLTVDHQFKADGDGGSADLPVAVDNTTAGARFAWMYNGCDGTGDWFPRPRMWTRYTDDSTITISRGFSGKAFPAWLQGVDFSELND